MTTIPDAEQFQLDVDSLEAALKFDDLPAAIDALRDREGDVYAVRVIRGLAARLLNQRRAA